MAVDDINGGAGAGFGSYTWVDYDEETNTVTAYSQTDVDYELAGDYMARVILTVTNEYGVVVASGYNNNGNNGIAGVELNFAGEAGRTYTAIGNHRAFISLWERDEFYPYTVYYFDTWYFTNFEGIGIYQPWYYYFTRPGYSMHQRQTATVSLGRTYDSVSITEVRPIVTINVPQTAMDGETVEFSVSVENGTPTGYLWSFEPTSGGNNPQVNFTAPTAATTQAKAHWFAKPNSPCSASLSSTYTIKVKVTFERGSPKTKEAPFTVNIPRYWGGSVDYPVTDGTPEYYYDTDRNLWTIVGRGTLQRVPSEIVMRTPKTSQFYDKTYKHEEVHFEQFTKPGRIFYDLFQIDSLMPRLLLLTDPDKQPLEQKFHHAKEEWRGEQRQIAIRQLPDAEREAHAVSDPIAPQYVFQLCP